MSGPGTGVGSAGPEGAHELVFPDGESVADLATYVARARTLDQDGAIRLQAVGEVLAAWVCVLPGTGVLRSGLVLGLRTMRLAGEHRLDVTVPLGALTDRFARRATTGDARTSLPVPPGEVAPPWAAVSPPRGGWEPVGALDVAVLDAAARAGIAEVAQGAPEGSGAAAVAGLRQRVWARPVRELAGGPGDVGDPAVTSGEDGDRPLPAALPGGGAFGVHALGFAGTAPQATLHRAGPWLRVSLPVGHVLLRP